MVLNYYKLAQQPFGVTPDPRFLYLSATHREAIASVLYSVKSGRGFTALIAEPGMGKTTVLFNLLQQLGGTAKTAFLFQAQDTPRNFLRNLLLDLGIADDGQDLVRMQVKLNECLLRETGLGKHFIVVVDEAQNLDEPVLEVVRMLSNFETPREKLMHIILAGQPQLAAKLASPQLQQLRQRVSIVARLKPFDTLETRAYIEHRLHVAGYCAEVPLFTDRSLALIAQYSGGIPRNINNLCFNAMSLGCAMKRQTIHAAVVEEVLSDLDLLRLTTAAPVAGFRTPSAAAPRSFVGYLASVLPKRRAVSVAIAAFTALLAGFGLTVVGRNLRFAPPPANSPANSAIVQPPAQVPSSTVPLPSVSTPSVDNQQPIAQPASTPSATNASPSDVAPAATNPVPAEKYDAGGRTNAAAVDYIIVHVSQDDTLYKICVANLGTYDAPLLARIRQLNPAIEDPGKIRVGQELRIPAPGSLLPATDLSAESLGTTSALEAKKR
jgi:general secretion pathway protein A